MIGVVGSALLVFIGGSLQLIATDTMPSPALETFLVPPPSGFKVDQTVPVPHGHFTANALAGTFGAQFDDASKQLEADGFVDGYGYVWYRSDGNVQLVEYVIAFSGGRGASSWLDHGKTYDQHEAAFRHQDSMSGIGNYFGEHYVYPSHDVGDYFIFVKGNEMFGVGYTSTKDNVLNAAMALAKAQYDNAPEYTIPPAEWPENAVPTPQGQTAPSAVAFPPVLMAAAAFLVVLAGGGLVLFAVYRRPRGSSPVAQTMSVGASWWDGERWRTDAPPGQTPGRSP